MNSRWKYLASTFGAAALALMLVGCEITITLPDDPFAGAPTVTAGSTPSVLTTGSVSSGSADYLVVSVPGSLSEDLLFVEADPTTAGSLTIEIFGSRYGSAVLRSTSNTTFGAASAVTPVAADAAGLGAAQILAGCAGPCIGTPNTVAEVLVRVSTTSSSPVSYDFFAYDSPYFDVTEPANDDCISPPVFTVDTFPKTYGSGAIERVGDVDCLSVVDGIAEVDAEFLGSSPSLVLEVTFTTDAPSTEVFYISDTNPLVQPTLAGNVVGVEVRALGDDLAGTLAGSEYEIVFY